MNKKQIISTVVAGAMLLTLSSPFIGTASGSADPVQETQNASPSIYHTNKTLPLVAGNDLVGIENPKDGDLLINSSGKRLYKYHLDSTNNGFRADWYQPFTNGLPDIHNGDALKRVIPKGGGANSLSNVKHFDESFDKLFRDNFLFNVSSSTVPYLDILGKGSGGIDLNYAAKGLGVAMDNGDVNGTLIHYSGYMEVLNGYSLQMKFRAKYVDNGLVIFVDNKKVFEYWASDSWVDNGTVVEGEEFWHDFHHGERIPFEAYYFDQGGGQSLSLEVNNNGNGWTRFEDGASLLDWGHEQGAWVYENGLGMQGDPGTHIFTVDSASDLSTTMKIPNARVDDIAAYLPGSLINLTGVKVYKCTKVDPAGNQTWQKITG